MRKILFLPIFLFLLRGCLDKIYGAHAMLVGGYSDQFKAFKLVNSWGAGWGDGGFVWVDYEAFDNVFDLNNPFRVLCQAFVGLN
jgi:cathepsin K